MKKTFIVLFCLSAQFIFSQADTIKLDEYIIQIKDGDSEVYIDGTGVFIRDGADTVLINIPNLQIITKEGVKSRNSRTIRGTDTKWVELDSIVYEVEIDTIIEESYDDVHEVSIDEDGIRIKDRAFGEEIIINNPLNRNKKKNIRTRWVLMDLGWNGVHRQSGYDENNPIDFNILPWKSTNVNLYVLQQRINLIDQKFFFKWGLGFDFYKFQFEDPIVLLKDQDQVTFEYFDNMEFKKNRLSFSYLTIPLMFHFRSNTKDRQAFKMSFGGFFGPRLGGNFKYKANNNKVKYHDDFHLTNWRYGLRGEFGFGFFNLYGTYNLNDMFKETKNGGYDQRIFTLGIILLPF